MTKPKSSEPEKPSAQGGRVATVGTYGFTNALPRITGALLAIIYTADFTLAEYGGYGILSVMTLLLSVFMDLGIGQAIMRNYYDHQHDWPRARRYLADAIVSADVIALISLPILGAALYWGWKYSGIESFDRNSYIILVLALALCERTSTMMSLLLRATERPMNYARGPVIDSAVSLICGIAFVRFFHWGVMGAIGAALCGRLASTLIYRFTLWHVLKIRGGRMDSSLIKKCLAFGLPLIPTRFAVWLRESGLRPILTHVTSLASVGIFSLASSVAVLPSLISTAVDLALSPYYLKQRTFGIEGFTARLEDFTIIMLAVLTPVWAAMILFSRQLIELIIGEHYIASAPISGILLCASFLRMQQPFFVRQIQFMRRTWIQSVVMVPTALASVALSLLFAAKYGIIFAAYGVLFAEIAGYIAFSLFIRAYEPLHFPLAVASGLSITLISLAVGNTWGSYMFVEIWSLLLVKFAILLVLTLACLFFWIWPKRAFLWHIVRH